MKYFLVFFLFFKLINAEDSTKVVSKIAFGSCLEQWNPQPVWKPILEAKPDLFLWLGDNIYFDSQIAEEKKYYYELLTNRKEYKDLKKNTRMLYTWDDHDYGVNDSGAEYKQKAESQKIFLEAFEEKKDSPRWKREGVYDSYFFGSKGKKVQIIMLDTRYFRSPLQKSWLRYFGVKKNAPNTSNSATVLGNSQWIWLEEEIKKEADLKIIVSSIQLLNDSHSFEKWGNFPKDRERLIQLIESQPKKNILVLSGDRHMSELSKTKDGLIDFTSSSLNKPFKMIKPEENPFRVGEPIVEENFGMVLINWETKQVSLKIIDSVGKERLSHEAKFE
jgi:alkaline phosphatase D